MKQPHMHVAIIRTSIPPRIIGYCLVICRFNEHPKQKRRAGYPALSLGKTRFFLFFITSRLATQHSWSSYPRWDQGTKRPLSQNPCRTFSVRTVNMSSRPRDNALMGPHSYMDSRSELQGNNVYSTYMGPKNLKPSLATGTRLALAVYG